MAGISFGTDADTIWIVAAWAFRQVLRDLRRDSTLDQASLDAITQAEHLGFLAVDRLPTALRNKLTTALDRMCRDILETSSRSDIEHVHPDDQTRRMYRQGIELLARAIQAAKKAE